MFILPQEYQSQYLKEIETYLHDLLYTLQLQGRPINFVRLIEALGYNCENLARLMIVNYLEKLDRDFMNCSFRKEKYYVKDHRPRTLITMYGEITYVRTIYTDRETGERFIYVDRKMGVARRIRYTEDVRAYAYEAYADENSMIKIGKELGNLIHSKFSLKRNDEYSLSRQTIYNFLKRVRPIHYVPETKIKTDTLFVLLDEKFIGCQDLDKKMMSKVCMTYAALEKGNRNALSGRYHFTSCSETFRYDLLTRIDEVYDLDEVKTFYFMSDGGGWIRETFKEMKLSGKTQITCLDRFHAYRALYDLCKDYTPYSIALYYISRNDRTSFLKSIRHFVRNKKDEENYKYLKNNFEQCVNMYYAPGPCAMEQCVSHHVMSQFTSVPKAYSSKNIERYLSMRDLYRNGHNLKKIYLEAISSQKDETEVNIVNRCQLDFSIFDKGSDIPYYELTNIRGKSLFLPH